MSLIEELKRRNVLRVGAAYAAVAWLLIQVVETLFPLFGLSDAAARTVVVVLAVGFVPALIGAWAFELTPEGLKRDAEVDHDSATSVRSTRRLDRVIMVFLALGLAYFAIDKFLLDPARDRAREQAVAEQARSEAIAESFGDKSIAVLAFQDLSPAGDQEYFSDGISEELLNLLSRIPELRVAGKTSAFSFKGKGATIAEIAAALNVAYVLEGSVRRAGDRIRITAQLIEARSDTHVWSQNYDRTFDDVFAIQDEIASKVVDQLRVMLLGAAPTVRRTDPEAYALYLQAADAMNRMSSESPAATEALVRKALEIDPEYVPAWILLARAQGYYATWGQSEREAARTQARASLEHALALEPAEPRALLMLEMLDPRASTDEQYVCDAITRALRTEPGSLDFLHLAGAQFLSLGRMQKSIEIYRYVLERDPLYLQALYSIIRAYLFSGHYDEAADATRRYIALTGGGGAHTLGVILLLKGDVEAAAAQFENLGDVMPEPVKLQGRALGLYATGRKAEADEVFARLRDDYGKPHPGTVVDPMAMISEVYAYLGDAVAAFEWIERRVAEEGEGPRWLEFNPMFAGLHGDPRWLPLLTRLGRSPEQLDAIRFEVEPPA